MPRVRTYATDEDALERVASESFAPRLASTVNIVVIVAVLLIQVINVNGLTITADTSPITTFERFLCYAGVSLLFVLQLVHSGRWFHPSRSWVLLVTLGVQGLISYLPIITLGEAWGGAVGFFMGSVLLLVRPVALGFTLFGAAEVLTGVIAVHGGQPPSEVAYAVVANGLTGLVIYSVAQLADIVADLHAARRELARTAVEEERTRFSRDLHDLLGYSLTAVTLKGELAYQNVEHDPAAAQRDLATLIGIARVALQDVRSVARSYRQLPLGAQLRSAQSVLKSAKIAVTLEQDDVTLPGVLETVLATVVREGVTNLMRHSKAENCAITVTTDDEFATLTIANDGLGDAARAGRIDDGLGGLDNLRQRVNVVNGTLDALVDGAGWFVLRATVPVRLSRRASEAAEHGSSARSGES